MVLVHQFFVYMGPLQVLSDPFLQGSIFDMIKGNESDIGNIDFELHAKTGDKFLCFTLFLN